MDHSNDDALPSLDQGFANWIAKSAGTAVPGAARESDLIRGAAPSPTKVNVAAIRAVDGPGERCRAARADLFKVEPTANADAVRNALGAMSAAQADKVARGPDTAKPAKPTWGTAEALSLTIAAQEDEITTLRGMLGLREAQVDELRREIEIANRQLAVLAAALADIRGCGEDRERSTRQTDMGDTEWTAPLGMLPRGMR
jgi:hypothetical protein